MDSLGQYLRALREEKQLSFEAVKSDIKLSVEQLSAIENNQLTRLGEVGIARAMVYTYARFLNADEKTAMYLFDQILPPQNKRGFAPQIPLKEKKVLISTNFIWMITIIFIVIVLGSITWISYSKGYLKRPFDKEPIARDTINTQVHNTHQPEKPDTLRSRMLELSKNNHKTTDKKEISKKKPRTDSKAALADTTDYVDGLLFESKESPFNQKL